MSEDTLIQIRQLTVRHADRLALDRVDLTVSRGRIITLIGPNGAGKTTLVKAALGLIRPTAGQVWRRPGLRLGYMPQRLSVDYTLPMSVRRFLSLWAKITPVQARDALAEVGAAHVLNQPVQALSGGEMQRVLLARALLRQPDLLVLDEPVQAVDVHGQIDLFERIADLARQRNIGVLLVSHDLHLVMARTDLVLCLNRHVCCSGHPEEVGRHPDYLALFGRHAEALALYHHHHDHRHEADGHIEPVHDLDHCHDHHHDPGCRHG